MNFNLEIYLIFIIFYLKNTFGVLTERQIQQTGRVMMNVCRASSGVQRSLVLRAAQGDIADDRKLKCFFGCVLETLQVIKNGKLYPELLRKRANAMLPNDIKEAILPTIEYCGNLENEDKCELAYSLIQCHFEISGTGKNPFIIRF
ncbi:general odorant-binding protein 72-like isoform X2 [Lycorma delicatula]|uniref:general odorant-binding protein 72-like isoform X2 n=1 Tax=Lycorma delicatula TaxID=130591 RepID=UPI003F516704